jgi:cell division protein FtsW (lipid II flippase)
MERSMKNKNLFIALIVSIIVTIFAALCMDLGTLYYTAIICMTLGLIGTIGLSITLLVLYLIENC